MKEPVETLVAQLNDLIVQATEERSHYYVKSVAVETRDALIALQAERDSWRRVAERVEHEKLALQERVERCEAERDALHEQFVEMRERWNRCAAYRDSLEADARRYRWLRDHMERTWCDALFCNAYAGTHEAFAAALDKAIEG